MRLFSWVSPRAAEFIAPPVATLLWYLSPRKRRVTRINLRAVYPDIDTGQRNRIARASMTHYVRGVFEAGILSHWPLRKVFGLIDEVQGMELYLEAKRSPRGVILVGAHSGAWELLNLYMHQHLDGAVLYKPSRHPDIEEMLLEKRRRGGGVMVPATGSGLRAMFKYLKNGKTIGLAADQEPTLGEGQFAPFYGVEALTGVLMPRMAQRTGAAVFFATCERCKGGRYRVHLFKAGDDIYDKDMRKAVTAVNQGIEQCINVDITQYLWAYKRFRNQPDGKISLYKR